MKGAEISLHFFSSLLLRFVFVELIVFCSHRSRSSSSVGYSSFSFSFREEEEEEGPISCKFHILKFFFPKNIKWSTQNWLIIKPAS